MQRVVNEMVKNTRTLRDWIVLVLGESGEPVEFGEICRRMIKRGWKTESDKPANLLRIQCYRLMEENLIERVEDSELLVFKVTEGGRLRARELWQKDLSIEFRNEWMTPAVINTAVGETRMPEVLNDALMDAGASDKVVGYCADPIKSVWLMEWIDKKTKSETEEGSES